MAIAGRTHKPIIDYEKCQTCSICLQACPAETMVEMRKEDGSLRGRIYSDEDNEIRITADKTLGLPPCQLHCPLQQDIRGYMKLIAKGRYRDALELIRETNPLPSVCGYICHHPCEGVCSRVKVDDPLSIRPLKRFVTDLDAGHLRPPTTEGRKNQKVTIIGSGPAGLAAAHELARKGYEVEVIESFVEPGGMLAWAIPDFRLPRDILKRDINYIRRMGVNFRTSVCFGSDLAISDLIKNGSKAVIIATGTQKSLRMNIENENDVEGYFDCLTFLRRCATRERIRIGAQVLIVGGGNAAIDAARSSLQLGAKKVTILYRRSLEEMPADKEEVNCALSEGVSIDFFTVPVKMMVSAGKVTGLECMKTQPQKLSNLKRRRPVAIGGSEFLVNGDAIISAIGQKPDYTLIAKGLLLNTIPKPSLVVDSNNMLLNMERVFVAGDFISGPTTVVDAMASGRKVAQAVDDYLSEACETNNE